MDGASLAVSVFAFALYVNTLGAGFVYDDSRAVLRNPDVRGGQSAWLAFGHDFWGTPLRSAGSHGSYRPLSVLSLRANAYLAGGMRPYGFHLVNAQLHALCSYLVTRLSRRLLGGLGGRGPGVWLTAGLLFAAHPVHCEAVAGIVGRADLLASALALLALLSFLQHLDWRERGCRCEALRSLRPGGRAAWCRCRAWSALLLAATMALAAAAMLCKEPGATVVAVCMVYDVVVQLGRRGRNRKTPFCASSLVALAAWGGALLAARLWLVGMSTPVFARADNPAAHEAAWATRTLTFLHLPVVNLRLLLWPGTLSFDWSMDAVERVEALADPRNLQSAALYAKMKICGVCSKLIESRGAFVYGYNNNNVVLANNNNYPVSSSSSSSSVSQDSDAGAAAVALAVVPLLPATNLFFYVGFVVAERVLYLPSVGYCLLVAQGLGWLADAKPPVAAAAGRAARSTRTWRGRGTAVMLAGVVLVAVLAARTLQRNGDWADEEDLYRAGIAVNPPKAYGNLGSVLSSRGRLAEAEHAFRMALRYRPNMAEVHYNLGNLLLKRDKLEEAIRSYQQAIHYRPSLALAHLHLGHALAARGQVREAVSALVRCASLRLAAPAAPATHEAARVSALLLLGHLHASQGRLRAAEKAVKEAIQARPQDYHPAPLYKLLAEVEERIKTQEERHSARDTLDYREAPTGKADAQQQPDKDQPQEQQQRNAWSWRTRSCNDSVLPGTGTAAGECARAPSAGVEPGPPMRGEGATASGPQPEECPMAALFPAPASPCA
ncbi:protein O-mannosyl-transferase TMTC2-like [Thrips palmi]|uniref:dolichyl-phosphate-mannose--protein mannosyltransferase n=1 Tax=Thrips palmi TaxID=161013 RepID=A0A6P9AF82_THRPL|nr:protein O-mannosyl-transferase TMTC2-like [Thrips palmi]